MLNCCSCLEKLRIIQKEVQKTGLDDVAPATAGKRGGQRAKLWSDEDPNKKPTILRKKCEWTDKSIEEKHHIAKCLVYIRNKFRVEHGFVAKKQRN